MVLNLEKGMSLDLTKVENASGLTDDAWWLSDYIKKEIK